MGLVEAFLIFNCLWSMACPALEDPDSRLKKKNKTPQRQMRPSLSGRSHPSCWTMLEPHKMRELIGFSLMVGSSAPSMEETDRTAVFSESVDAHLPAVPLCPMQEMSPLTPVVPFNIVDAGSPFHRIWMPVHLLSTPLQTRGFSCHRLRMLASPHCGLSRKPKRHCCARLYETCAGNAFVDHCGTCVGGAGPIGL